VTAQIYDVKVLRVIVECCINEGKHGHFFGMVINQINEQSLFDDRSIHVATRFASSTFASDTNWDLKENQNNLKQAIVICFRRRAINRLDVVISDGFSQQCVKGCAHNVREDLMERMSYSLQKFLSRAPTWCIYKYLRTHEGLNGCVECFNEV